MQFGALVHKLCVYIHFHDSFLFIKTDLDSCYLRHRLLGHCEKNYMAKTTFSVAFSKTKIRSLQFFKITILSIFYKKWFKFKSF